MIKSLRDDSVTMGLSVDVILWGCKLSCHLKIEKMLLTQVHVLQSMHSSISSPFLISHGLNN
jgi:hypothetical protein